MSTDTPPYEGTTPIQLWAVKCPDGSIDLNTVRTDKSQSRLMLHGYATDMGKIWAMLELGGYSIVRVRVEEVTE